MVADVVWCLAVRHVPDDLAPVQVDRGDAPPWRFHQWKSLNRHADAPTNFGTYRLPLPLGQRRVVRRCLPWSYPVRSRYPDVVHVRPLRIMDESKRKEDLGVREHLKDAGLRVVRTALPV